MSMNPSMNMSMNPSMNMRQMNSANEESRINKLRQR